MRKTLLLFVATIVWAGIQAQDVMMESHELTQEKYNENAFLSKAKDTSNWFNYGREISNIASSMPYFRNFLFPDSTVQVEFSNGYGYVWIHSLAQVLDPTSNYFITLGGGISKDATYTLDSIAIPYRYRRVQTAFPDTLIIQIFTHSQMSYVETPNWSTPKSYARVPYDYMLRKGDNPAKEIILTLDESDTSTATQSIIEEFIDIDFQADEKVAMTYTYIPGNPFNVGDTIDWYINPLPNKQINSFVAYTFRDETPTIENGYYNHAGLVTSAVRYNDTVNSNGWEGQYIPGVAYIAGTYHSDVWFRLTYEDYSGVSNYDLFETFDIYPNPSNSFINIEFASQIDRNSKLEIYDILGTKAAEIDLSSEVGVKQFDVSNLEKGVYFATLKVNGEIAMTKRLILGN